MAAKGGESKTGLIASLVIAILLVIGLGVATYYGYAGQEELQKSAKQANDKKVAAEKNRDWHNFLAVQYKSYLGVASKQDLNDLSAMRAKYESGGIGKGEPNFAENENVIKKLDDKANLGWNLPEARPTTTAFERVGALENEKNELRRKLEAALGEVKAAQDAKRQAEEFAASAAADFKKNLAALNQKYLQLETQKQAAFVAMQSAFETESKRVEDAEKKGVTSTEDLQKQITKLVAENKELENQVVRLSREKSDIEKERNRLRGQIDPVNPLESGPARGKIVRLDRSGAAAWINLGSADNIKPQIRFSLFKDKGNGTATGELKGSLQVTEVVSEHLSKAQITYTRDPNRDPILGGDLLYNPTWSPTSREHVAVAGVIDLTGLGTDNTAEFVRTLERQGVEVDAYLDLKEMAVKGKGMTLQTSYLILGDRNDANMAKVNDLTEDALKMGIQVVPLRRYLVLTGFRVPRGLAEGAALGTAIRQPTPKKKEPAKADEKPAPKDEMKKDDGKDGK